VPGPPPALLTVSAAVAELLVLSGSIAAVRATAVTVKLPAVAVLAVNSTVRVAPTSSSWGSQEILLAPTLQARPPASTALTASPVGTSMDSRASDVTLGPLLIIEMV